MKALAGIVPKVIERTTNIEGQSFPIHEFTSDKWLAIIKPLREPEKGETADDITKNTLDVVIVGMEGEDHEPTEEERFQVKKLLTNGCIHEYLHRLCMLNDYGFDSVKAAEKKYEAVLSNDTKSN